MASVKNLLLDGSRGKVGNVVFANWRGIQTMRSVPVDPHNPNSTLQQEQRNAFRTVVGVSRTLLPWSRIAYRLIAKKKSEYNVMVSELLSVFDKPNNCFKESSMKDFKASVGSLEKPQLVCVDGADNNTISCTFSKPAINHQGNPTDRLAFLAFDLASGNFGFVFHPTDRAVLTSEFNVVFPFDVSSAHVWSMFVSSNAAQCSDSSYNKL